VNLTEESKNFKMLEFPLNQLQTYYGYLCGLLSFIKRMLATKVLIFLSQTESTPKHFLKKKALAVSNNKLNVQNFRCCDDVDWIVGDLLMMLPGKLQPSSLQWMSHENHCYILKEKLLIINGQRVGFTATIKYCVS
jgi:hypothetical protein